MEINDNWKFERDYREKGYAMICGADEAGAGPLAGPVYAAAVVLPFETQLEWLNDSKKVTKKRREVLFDQIQAVALAWSIQAVDVETIEKINILEARLLAMERAIQALEPAADFALIDGNRDKGITCPHIAVIGGDAASANIAAASILAKVARDRHMEEMALIYPEYEFQRHHGYGTKLHFERLRAHGISPIHRRSFLKNL